MKKSILATALASLATFAMAPAPALAQDVPEAVAAALKVGATVYGPEGAEVGTIKAMPGGNVTVFTGKNDATLPANAFGMNDKGLLLSMTKAQLDSAVEAALAKADAAMDAALVPEAPIHSRDGVLVGSVKSVSGDDVQVSLADGPAITLKKEHMTAGDDGLKLFMTAAELKAAVASAVPASAEAAAEAGA